MIRETSLEAHKIITDNGLLSERRLRVYQIIFDHGPLIGSEVARLYYIRFGRTSASETIRNRITELRNLGVVQEVGRSMDGHTGMKVILWDVTKNLPDRTKIVKKTKCEHCKGKGYK